MIISRDPQQGYGQEVRGNWNARTWLFAGVLSAEAERGGAGTVYWRGEAASNLGLMKGQKAIGCGPTKFHNWVVCVAVEAGKSPDTGNGEGGGRF